jgi:hypothetical protein
MVYRGQRGTPGSTAGIHWSTSRDVARSLTRSDADEVMAVELTDPEKQVIPYGALRSAYYDEKRGQPEEGNMAWMQGFPSEEEIRLRPGAQFNVNGREVTIDNTRGHIVYPNLHNYAATPEASLREWGHAVGELGHVQTSMLDSVHPGRGDTPAAGYIPSLDLHPGSYPDASDAYYGDLLKFGHHPDAPEWATHEGRSMDQYVKPAKHREQDTPAAQSRREAFGQMQFPGMEDHA